MYYSKLIITLLIITIIQLISADDLVSIVKRIDKISEKIKSPDISLASYVNLIQELSHLMSKLDIYSEYGDDLMKPLDTSIDMELRSVVMNFSERLDSINRLNRKQDRRAILFAFNKLRPFLKPYENQEEYNNTLEKLDSLRIGEKIDEIYDRIILKNSKEAATSAFEASSSNTEPDDIYSLAREYKALREEALRFNLEISIKMFEIDNHLAKDLIDKVYKEMMAPKSELELIESAIEFIVALSENKVFMSNDLEKIFSEIREKAVVLRGIGFARSDPSKCNGAYIDDVEQLKANFRGLRAEQYIELMRQRHVEFCFQYIESDTRKRAKLDYELDSSLARLGRLSNFVLENTNSIGTLDDNEISDQDLGYFMMKYFESLESSSLEQSNEEVFVKVNENFEAFIRRHCRALRLWFHQYYFIITVLRYPHPHPPLQFWTRELVRAGNICRRTNHTDGRDWHMLSKEL